jgi:Tol biopolymer transport system component
MRATLALVAILAAALAAGAARGVTPARNGAVHKNGLVYFDNFDSTSLTSDIYSIASNGSGLKNLTNTSTADETEPALSPNRKLIAFLSDEGGAVFHLFLMTSSGGGAHALAAGGVAQASPAWSPNGKLIAFSRCLALDPYGGGCTRAQIAVIGANGRGAKALTKAPAGSVDSRPAWAPDGKSLAFQRTSAAGTVTLWTMNANGKSPKRIVNDGSSIDLNPSYTPNGKLIVYSSDAGGHEALWSIDTKTRKRARVLAETPDPEDPSTGAGTEDPSVSPNGKQIVYTSAGDLWTVGINGKGAAKLTTAGGGDADWGRG